MDYPAVLQQVVRGLVENPDAVRVEIISRNRRNGRLIIYADDADRRRIIGQGANMIRALQSYFLHLSRFHNGNIMVEMFEGANDRTPLQRKPYVDSLWNKTDWLRNIVKEMIRPFAPDATVEALDSSSAVVIHIRGVKIPNEPIHPKHGNKPPFPGMWDAMVKIVRGIARNNGRFVDMHNE